MNKLIVGEEGGIGSELSTSLTEDQATQGMTVSWLLLEQKSDRAIPNKKAVARLPTDV